MFSALARISILPVALSFSSCAYLVDVVRVATQEEYVSGSEAKARLMTAALVGYSVRQGTTGNGDLLSAAVSFAAARIKSDREYLDSSVHSCEEILLMAGATGQNVYNGMLAGVFCNMGPGKQPDEL